jgi:hypothetical protein
MRTAISWVDHADAQGMEIFRTDGDHRDGRVLHAIARNVGSFVRPRCRASGQGGAGGGDRFHAGYDGKARRQALEQIRLVGGRAIGSRRRVDERCQDAARVGAEIERGHVREHLHHCERPGQQHDCERHLHNGQNPAQPFLRRSHRPSGPAIFQRRLDRIATAGAASIGLPKIAGRGK